MSAGHAFIAHFQVSEPGSPATTAPEMKKTSGSHRAAGGTGKDLPADALPRSVAASDTRDKSQADGPVKSSPQPSIQPSPASICPAPVVAVGPPVSAERSRRSSGSSKAAGESRAKPTGVQQSSRRTTKDRGQKSASAAAASSQRSRRSAKAHSPDQSNGRKENLGGQSIDTATSEPSEKPQSKSSEASFRPGPVTVVPRPSPSVPPRPDAQVRPIMSNQLGFAPRQESRPKPGARQLVSPAARSSDSVAPTARTDSIVPTKVVAVGSSVQAHAAMQASTSTAPSVSVKPFATQGLRYQELPVDVEEPVDEASGTTLVKPRTVASMPPSVADGGAADLAPAAEAVEEPRLPPEVVAASNVVVDRPRYEPVILPPLVESSSTSVLTPTAALPLVEKAVRAKALGDLERENATVALADAPDRIDQGRERIRSEESLDTGFEGDFFSSVPPSTEPIVVEPTLEEPLEPLEVAPSAEQLARRDFFRGVVTRVMVVSLVVILLAAVVALIRR